MDGPTSVKSEKTSKTSPIPMNPNASNDSIVVVVSVDDPNTGDAVELVDADPEVIRPRTGPEANRRSRPKSMNRALETTNLRKSNQRLTVKDWL